jgi:hypothetical protein
VIAPTDGEGGGTWLSVNDRGVSATLLNGYGFRREGERFTSRGLFLRSIADSPSQHAAIKRAASTDLRRYAPFLVALFERGLEPAVLAWDGRSLRIDLRGDRHRPLVSSSFDACGVRDRRRARLRSEVSRRGGWRPGVLMAFHESHEDGPSAYSTCMHRNDAETRSFIRVRVAEGLVALEHRLGSPCRMRGRVRLEMGART